MGKGGGGSGLGSLTGYQQPPQAQASTSNNQAGANTAGGKGGAAPQGGAGGKGGTYAGPQLGQQGPAGTVQGGGANSPFAQGQQMYAQPFMQSGMGQQGQMPQGQNAGPYSFQPYGVQQGYNPQAVTAGMQGYYTPIPQQMPQSPYQAGYTYGGNAPPSNPQNGQNLPLAPIMPSQIAQNSALAGLPGSTASPAKTTSLPTHG